MLHDRIWNRNAYRYKNVFKTEGGVAGVAGHMLGTKNKFTRHNDSNLKGISQKKEYSLNEIKFTRLRLRLPFEMSNSSTLTVQIILIA